MFINLVLLDRKRMAWSRGPRGQGLSLAFTAAASALCAMGHQLPEGTGVGLDTAQVFFILGPEL